MQPISCSPAERVQEVSGGRGHDSVAQQVYGAAPVRRQGERRPEATRAFRLPRVKHPHTVAVDDGPAVHRGDGADRAVDRAARQAGTVAVVRRDGSRAIGAADLVQTRNSLLRCCGTPWSAASTM